MEAPVLAISPFMHLLIEVWFGGDGMNTWKSGTGVIGLIGLIGLLVGSAVAGEDSGGKKFIAPDSGEDSYQRRTPEQARRELSEREIQITQSSFFDRVGQGDLFAVQLFRDAGMAIHAPNGRGTTALMLAAKAGHMEIVQFLVDNGADKNAQNDRGKTALLHAARFSRL
ncbi:MAG: ankyrin repeat domain-containing protein, partial [Gemmatimonadetes bacterium]|nr:ankyrin repeat domain-containing protein [Gemmatimonadota bacterium]